MLSKFHAGKISLIQGINGCSLYEIYNEKGAVLTNKIDKLFIVIGIIGKC